MKATIQTITKFFKTLVKSLSQFLSNFYPKPLVKWGLVPVIFLMIGIGLFAYSTLTTDDAFSVIVSNHKEEIKVENSSARIEFASEENNIGIISIPFEIEEIEQEIDFDEGEFDFGQTESGEETPETEIEVSEDELDQETEEETIMPEKLFVFKIKEKNSPEWHDIKELSIDQFKNRNFYHFGFPVLENSFNKQIVVEVESQAFSNGTLKISEKYPSYVTKYKYCKSEITATPLSFIAFSVKKTINTLQNYPISFALTVILFPVYYLITRIYFEKNKYNEGYLNLFTKNLFLILLLIISIASFDYSLLGENFTYYYLVNNLKNVNTLFVYPTILIGLVTFYKNKELIEKRVEEDQEQEKLTEQKRAKEFLYKHPHLAQIPVLRYLFKWVYKNSWYHSLSLILLIIFMIVSQSYKLSYQHLWIDEVLSFLPAKQILLKGKPSYDSGYTYNRAPTYHRLVSISMAFWGINSFGARVINVFFNVILAFLLYLFIKKFDKKIAILSVFLYSTSNYVLGMTRWVRMYAMFAMLFFGMVYSFYNSIIDSDKNSRKFLFVTFNPKQLVVFLIITYFSYETHKISATLLIGLIFYYFISIFKFKNKNKFLKIFISLLLIFIIGIYYKSGTLNPKIALIDRNAINYLDNPIRPKYYWNLFQRVLPIFNVLAILAPAILLNLKEKRYIYLFSIFTLPFVYLSIQRRRSERYIYHLIPILTILFPLSFAYLTKISKKLFNSVLIYLFLFIIIFQHCFFFKKEIFEINKFDYASMFKNKKRNYDKVISYLESREEDYLLLADGHSTFTLYVKGYVVDYILLRENDYKLDKYNADKRLQIPYLANRSENYKNILNSYKNIVIISKYKDIYDKFWRLNEEKPYIYIKD
jgi:hypothetical protein